MRGSAPAHDDAGQEGLRRLAGALVPSLEATELDARGDCQIGAWMAIIRPGRSAIRLSHLLAHQVGASWGVPHGLTSAVLLPAVMRYLAPATEDAQAVIAAALGVPVAPDPSVTAERAAHHVEMLIRTLGLPTRLRDVIPPDGATRDQVIDRAYAEAVQLGCTADLPAGAASLAEVIDLAW